MDTPGGGAVEPLLLFSRSVTVRGGLSICLSISACAGIWLCFSELARVGVAAAGVNVCLGKMEGLETE